MTAGAAPASTSEAQAGLVERVTFHNPESGFCVLRVKARGQKDLITVIAHAATITAGEFVLAGWAEQKVIRETKMFLHANGVSTSRAVRIYKTYGTGAVQVISENPYRLARDIRGIGFRTADQIAARLGIEKTAMIRVRAGISYAPAEAMDEGHCGLPAEELASQTETLIEVPAALIETALALELETGDVVADTLEGRRCIFLAGLHRAEHSPASGAHAL
jgi:exodeoxyribonuclease V alpha subunit